MVECAQSAKMSVRRQHKRFLINFRHYQSKKLQFAVRVHIARKHSVVVCGAARSLSMLLLSAFRTMRTIGNKYCDVCQTTIYQYLMWHYHSIKTTCDNTRYSILLRLLSNFAWAIFTLCHYLNYRICDNRICIFRCRFFKPLFRSVSCLLSTFAIQSHLDLFVWQITHCFEYSRIATNHHQFISTRQMRIFPLTFDFFVFKEWIVLFVNCHFESNLHEIKINSILMYDCAFRKFTSCFLHTVIL